MWNTLYQVEGFSENKAAPWLLPAQEHQLYHEEKQIPDSSCGTGSIEWVARTNICLGGSPAPRS